jgi:acyl-CoA synthetase (AMP-forming)/AMP-acid ligase II
LSHTRIATLLDALSPAKSARAPSITLIDDDERETSIPLASLREDAVRFGHALRQAGVRTDDRVPIVLPTSREFLVAFFGSIYAGAVPAPVGMPGFGDIENFGRRMGLLGSYLRASHVITEVSLREATIAAVPDATFIDGASTLASGAALGVGDLPTIAAEDIALIQCTSGSTGVPKGVMLSHKNLLANCRQIGNAVDVRQDDVVVCWLPLNHDMGIIGCVLFAITCGIDLVLLSPSKFLRRPSAWLRAISKHRGTLSPAPNFAYGYLSSRVKMTEVADCDLSSWRVAFCGAEPIDADTLLRFTRAFAPNGLRADVLLPCYGLAEASLAVTFHRYGTPMKYDIVDREALAMGRATDPVHEGASQTDLLTSKVVSCGVPLEGTRIRVVDSERKDLPERYVGRVLIRGPSVTADGYFELPEETAEVLGADGWLDTGDLGYLREGELYITGREKDIIIIRGKSYVPTDFEWPAAEVPGIRSGGVVAFGVFDASRGTELLHLICETDVKGDLAREKLREEVAANVARRSGVRPDFVRLVRRYAILKTTSGKARRSKTRQAYLAEESSRRWRFT